MRAAPFCLLLLAQFFFVNTTTLRLWTGGEQRIHRSSVGHAIGPRWVQDAAGCAARPWTCSHNWTWVDPERPFLDREDACFLLVSAGVTRILFVGDSFIRQVYQAMLLVLSGDPEHESMDGYAPPSCDGEGAFADEHCRHTLQMTSGAYCGGRVVVRLKYGPFPLLDDTGGFFSALVWGVGSHPRDGDYNWRKGVNNASYVSADTFHPHCRVNPPEWLNETVRGRRNSTAVYWLPPHARLVFRNPDEAPNVIQSYATESAVEVKKWCGVESIEAPYALTRDLVDKHNAVARNSTYDGTHWGRAVNVMKAQAVMYAIAGRKGKTLAQHLSNAV